MAGKNWKASAWTKCGLCYVVFYFHIITVNCNWVPTLDCHVLSVATRWIEVMLTKVTSLLQRNIVTLLPSQGARNLPLHKKMEPSWARSTWSLLYRFYCFHWEYTRFIALPNVHDPAGITVKRATGIQMVLFNSKTFPSKRFVSLYIENIGNH